MEAEASDASDETPPGKLPSLGKRLAPSKEASVSPTDETSADREVFSGLPPSKVGGFFYSPAVDLALGWHYHVSYGNTNAHCCVADLHRRIKIIPPVYVEVPLIAWQAVQIFGIAKYLVTMTKHICFVLCDLFHYLFYSSVIQCAPCEARPNQIYTNTKKEGISIHTPRMGRDCRLPLQLVAHPAMPAHPSLPHSLHSGSAAVC